MFLVPRASSAPGITAPGLAGVGGLRDCGWILLALRSPQIQVYGLRQRLPNLLMGTLGGSQEGTCTAGTDAERPLRYCLSQPVPLQARFGGTCHSLVQSHSCLFPEQQRIKRTHGAPGLRSSSLDFVYLFLFAW